MQLRLMMKISDKVGRPVNGLWIGAALCLLLLPTFAHGADIHPADAAKCKPVDLPILQRWSGDYPVAELKRLPEGQRKTRVGFFGDGPSFAAAWPAFKPGEKVPQVDFVENLVVFSRNRVYYNRTSIAKVTIQDGVAEVMAIETRSSAPVADKAAMAMAVIPREGVKFIQAGKERIPVPRRSLPQSAKDPLNATYLIEGQEIRLVNGHSELEAAPGASTKIRTDLFGKPIYGDLDDDGDEDTALLLVHNAGGSGTFYYVAASLNQNGQYRGTKAVLLGDRIAPQDVIIRNGVIVVNYADRRPEESMTASPSVGKSMYLMMLKGGDLAALPASPFIPP